MQDEYLEVFWNRREDYSHSAREEDDTDVCQTYHCAKEKDERIASLVIKDSYSKGSNRQKDESRLESWLFFFGLKQTCWIRVSKKTIRASNKIIRASNKIIRASKKMIQASRIRNQN